MWKYLPISRYDFIEKIKSLKSYCSHDLCTFLDEGRWNMEADGPRLRPRRTERGNGGVATSTLVGAWRPPHSQRRWRSVGTEHGPWPIEFSANSGDKWHYPRAVSHLTIFGEKKSCEPPPTAVLTTNRRPWISSSRFYSLCLRYGDNSSWQGFQGSSVTWQTWSGNLVCVSEFCKSSALVHLTLKNSFFQVGLSTLYIKEYPVLKIEAGTITVNIQFSHSHFLRWTYF